MTDIERFEKAVIEMRNTIATARMRKWTEGNKREFINDGLVLSGIALVLNKFDKIVRRR